MLKVATLLDLLHGAGVTVAVSMLAIAAGIPLGLMLAAGRTGRSRVVRAFCAAYSSFVRAVPVVTFMMLIYFGLPALGIALDPFPAAVFALALNTAAFNGEIWRAGIADFPHGQLEAARAFGMTVIGVDPKDMPFNPDVSRMVTPDRLDTVLPLADVVFISAPHTPQSEGMVGPKQFELMKKGAYFIAVSRGKVYNTEALVKALDERRLAGAGMDVTNPEPLPKGHALWKFENVIITPHIATLSDGVGARYHELVLDNVARFSKGEPLRNLVDKIKGF